MLRMILSSMLVEPILLVVDLEELCLVLEVVGEEVDDHAVAEGEVGGADGVEDLVHRVSLPLRVRYPVVAASMPTT